LKINASYLSSEQNTWTIRDRLNSIKLITQLLSHTMCSPFWCCTLLPHPWTKLIDAAHLTNRNSTQPSQLSIYPSSSHSTVMFCNRSFTHLCVRCDASLAQNPQNVILSLPDNIWPHAWLHIVDLYQNQSSFQPVSVWTSCISVDYPLYDNQPMDPTKKRTNPCNLGMRWTLAEVMYWKLQNKHMA
jgi:hypothetical protein